MQTRKLSRVYIVIVILPVIIGTILLAYQRHLDKRVVKEHDAYHRLNSVSTAIDLAIGDMIADVRLLSNLLQKTDLEEPSVFLEEMNAKHRLQYEKDCGFSFVRINGNIYRETGIVEGEIYEEHYYEHLQIAKSSGSLVIGFYQGEGVEPSIGILKPVANGQDEIQGVVILKFTPDLLVRNRPILRDMRNFKISDISSGSQVVANLGEDASQQGVSLALDNVDWKATTFFHQPMRAEMLRDVTLYFSILFLSTHGIFFIYRTYNSRRNKHLEEQMQKMKRLELVGEIAGTFAHEIRNPMTGIKGFVDLLKMKHLEVEDQFYFTIIHEEIERINNIVGEFLVLGKPTIDNRKDEDLNEIVERAMPIMVSAASQYAVEVEKKLAEEALWFHCDKDHMKQLLINLVKNAVEASSEGQTVIVETEKKGDELLLRVIDCGEGVPKENLNHLFEPFMTTKETGTGLGLVVCKTIVDRYGGKITVQSTIGKGTRFTVHLPAG